jgi:Rha family phage regulatory protein
MNNQLTSETLPFVAVINGELKTTSLKIAEHFGKEHKSVLRAIENLQCSPEFTERNFALSEYTDITGRKLPCYEITKDGLAFAAMGFTGKKAAKWKEAYINAFNSMAEEIYQVKSLKNSFKLIEPPTITNAQQGELHAIVANKARSCNKFNSYYWSRFQNHFKLSSYKLLPAERFQEALDFFKKLEGDEKDSFFMLSPKELSALANENQFIEKDGLVMRESSLTFTLPPLEKNHKLKRWLISQIDGLLTFHALADNQEVLTKETFIRQLIHDDYIVLKKDDFINKLQQ